MKIGSYRIIKETEYSNLLAYIESLENITKQLATEPTICQTSDISTSITAKDIELSQIVIDMIQDAQKPRILKIPAFHKEYVYYIPDLDELHITDVHPDSPGAVRYMLPDGTTIEAIPFGEL